MADRRIFDPSRLKRLDEHLQRAVEDGRIVGAAAMVGYEGEVYHTALAGHADREAGKPIELDTIFRIYSLSKPVTSVAVMMLFEEGRFLLTDPVDAYLPEFTDIKVFVGGTLKDPILEEPKRELRVADLLNHTSGFTYGGDETHVVDRMYEQADLFRYDGTIGEMVERLGQLPLKFHPGSDFEYGISHDVLGRLVEVVSGQSFDRFLHERLFEPLGMIDTVFSVPAEKVGRLATVYTHDKEGRLVPEDPAHSKRFLEPVTFFAGGEGLVSTPLDCHAFVTMLQQGGRFRNQRFLSRKTIELMVRNHLSTDMLDKFWLDGMGYGLGFGVIVDPAAYKNLGSLGEYGWAGSASTFFWVDPVERLTLLLFTQYMPSSETTIAREFKTLVFQALE